MKLRTLVNILTKNLPERCLDYDVIYQPDETGYEIVSVDYNDDTKTVWINDEIENK